MVGRAIALMSPRCGSREVLVSLNDFGPHGPKGDKAILAYPGRRDRVSSSRTQTVRSSASYSNSNAPGLTRSSPASWQACLSNSSSTTTGSRTNRRSRMGHRCSTCSLRRPTAPVRSSCRWFPGLRSRGRRRWWHSRSCAVCRRTTRQDPSPPLRSSPFASSGRLRLSASQAATSRWCTSSRLTSAATTSRSRAAPRLCRPRPPST
jgi:hypothetical protein